MDLLLVSLLYTVSTMWKVYRDVDWTPAQRVFLALGGFNIVNVILFLARSAEASNQRYWFLLWNAFLALLPLGFAWWLSSRLENHSWKHWQNVILTVLWIIFLPNSFYMVSDLIHLHQTGEVSVLYDAIMFTSFILSGLLTGLMSIYLVHRQLLRRLPAVISHSLVAFIFFACGFSVYLGRVLRWNSWDLFLHPAAVLFDVSNQVISPASQGVMGTTLGMFFLLGGVYTVVWNMIKAVTK